MKREECDKVIADFFQRTDDDDYPPREEDLKDDPIPIYGCIVAPAPGCAYGAPFPTSIEGFTHYDLILKGYDKTKKMGVLKWLRERFPDDGLAQALVRLDSLPFCLDETHEKWAVDITKKQLEDVGFEVELKGVLW